MAVQIVSLLIVVAAIYAVFRRVDVRIALLTAALAIAGMTGDLRPIVREFFNGFSNERTVVPICCAMGFAYVLRHTECDRHLVLLLSRPLRSWRFLLIPGVIAIGFLVNIPVISQTSTAVCIGTVLVPLMRSAGFSSVTIGASILLGASIGGELLNPGAPELNTVAQKLNAVAQKSNAVLETPQVAPGDVVRNIFPLLMIHLPLAAAIFWFLAVRFERKQPPQADPSAVPVDFRLNIVRALIPFVPLVILFLVGPPFKVFQVPTSWVTAESKVYETRLIGAAMLFGVLIAAVATPRKTGGCAKAFFEGAGYAFAEVISLIVIANCFGKAIEVVGLADLIGRGIREVPALLTPLAGIVPAGFAIVCGSGIASTQSLYPVFVDPATAVGADPQEIGAIVSIASAAGRTMSPVAAVALMCAKLTGTTSFQLMSRVAPPLLVGLAAIIVLRMLGVA